MTLPGSVGVSGHQARTGIDWEWVAKSVGDVLREKAPVSRVFSSLAAGSDQVFAEEALAQGIPVTAFIPFPDYERCFTEGLGRYRELLSRCERVVLDGAHTPTLYEAWIGITAYMLQIYFDFAGYSNMAIGLAIAMGLKFPRNFNLPYGALSITDHWRRWHISLSTWFRDYLYIPIGGSRCGPLRNLANLWAVFFLCGLWHGASWNFIAWGVHHGTFLVLERLGLGALLDRSPRVLRHAYMLLVVLTSFVWFRTSSIDGSLTYFGSLLGLHGAGALPSALMAELHPMTIAVFVLGWPLAMFGLPRPMGKGLPEKLRLALFGTGDTLVTALLFLLCVMSVGAAAYSPFLYFRF